MATVCLYHFTFHWSLAGTSGLSNKKQHISLALLVVELWTSKVDEYVSRTLLKIQVISLCFY